MTSEQKEGFPARKAALDFAVATSIQRDADAILRAAKAYHAFLLGNESIEFKTDEHGQIWARSTELPD